MVIEGPLVLPTSSWQACWFADYLVLFDRPYRFVIMNSCRAFVSQLQSCLVDSAFCPAGLSPIVAHAQIAVSCLLPPAPISPPRSRNSLQRSLNWFSAGPSGVAMNLFHVGTYGPSSASRLAGSPPSSPDIHCLHSCRQYFGSEGSCRGVHHCSNLCQASLFMT